MAEAEAALKKGGGLFGAFFGISADTYQDAAEKFQRAGLAFKGSKRWADAAKAYQRAGECFVKAKSDGEASNAYVECARSHVKAGDGHSATEILEREAMPRIVESGRLSQAAKLHQELAETLESEGQLESAIENFQKAADYFAAENATSSAQKAEHRVGRLNAMLDPPNLERASEILEKIGSDSLSNSLLKFQAKNHFFDAVLCTLATTDIVTADAKLARYKEMDYTFPGCRECKLLEDIVQAYKDMNTAAFTDAIFAYDQISKLEPWRTKVLLMIKKSMPGATGGAAASAGGATGGAGTGEIDIT